MLVLSRKTDQSIVIGNNVEIMVVGVDKSGQVKLGIRAPKEVDVKRKELLSPLDKNLVKILS